MSHFTVLVIGENPEKQLQPFHEYECTGIEDEYVKFVEAEESKYELDKTFEDNKKDYSSFDDFMKNYYGYSEQEGKYGRKTNPNSKWDWYELGGRWTGFFKMKKGNHGGLGKAGVFNNKAKLGYADSALKKQIDFEFMIKEAGDKAKVQYEEIDGFLGKLPKNKTWDEIRDSNQNMDEAKCIYWEQKRCKEWENIPNTGFDDSPDEYLISKDQYIKNAEDSAICTFAIVKDGKWYERGKMGYWAFISDEKEKEEWNNEFMDIISELPDDALLSLYDCHI